MVLLGLGAAGKAGNASDAGAFLFKAVDETLRDGIGETRTLEPPEEEAQGVWPGFAPMRPPDAGGRAGNGLLDDGDDQLAFWFAVDREDCTVELFSFNTLDPPWPAVAPFSASPVDPPGNEG